MCLHMRPRATKSLTKMWSGHNANQPNFNAYSYHRKFIMIGSRLVGMAPVNAGRVVNVNLTRKSPESVTM
jgi:hypothetical protein